MDNLARESTLAIQAGMSYGKWKALQGFKPIVKEPVKPLGNKFTCGHFGKVFYKQDKRAHKYCSEQCQHRASNARQYEKKERQGRPQKICKWCGGTFTPTGSRHFYCCTQCKTDYHNQRKREKRYGKP